MAMKPVKKHGSLPRGGAGKALRLLRENAVSTSTRARYMAGILGSKCPDVIADLVVRSFSDEPVNRHIPKLKDKQLASAAQTIATIGTAFQALDAWGALPIEPANMSARKILFERATQNRETVMSDLFMKKLAFLLRGAEDIARLLVCFDNDQRLVNAYLALLATIHGETVFVENCAQAAPVSTNA